MPKVIHKLMKSRFNKNSKTHKIFLFKSSVNFKRFTFKITKFKRKSLIRMKHRSLFLIYTQKAQQREKGWQL